MLLLQIVLQSVAPTSQTYKHFMSWNTIKPSTCDADLFVACKGNQQHNIPHVHMQPGSSTTSKETAGQLLVAKAHRLGQL